MTARTRGVDGETEKKKGNNGQRGVYPRVFRSFGGVGKTRPGWMASSVICFVAIELIVADWLLCFVFVFLLLVPSYFSAISVLLFPFFFFCK